MADAEGPAYNVRCYLERRTLREMLSEAVDGRLAVGVDVGCGYGRMSMLLTEFCDRVVGLEREASLLAIARSLLPDLEFVDVPALTRLPLEDQGADLLMTFTVLQHLTDDDVPLVLGELRRAVKRGGLILLMEKTDPGSRYSSSGDTSDGTQFLSVGRAVETYTRWMAPCELIQQREGRVEPTYPGFDRVGTYMLFRAPPEPF